MVEAEGAAYNSGMQEAQAGCLEDTRTDILHNVMEWAKDGSELLYWLSGMAGTGKSTISRTIAKQLQERNKLAASFFFSRNAGELGHSRRLITTLAAQMARNPNMLGLGKHMAKVIEENPDITSRSLADQWNFLVLKPLGILNKHVEGDNSSSPATSPRIMVMVLDALDECDSDTGRGKDEELSNIIRVLSGTAAVPNGKIELRIFITSRPENAIVGEFRSVTAPNKSFILHREVEKGILDHDLSLYISSRLERVREEECLSSTWPDQKDVDALVDLSDGLFIYAATICKFITDRNFLPDERLQVALRSSPGSLDDLYSSILHQHLFEGIDAKRRSEADNLDLSKRFRTVVG